MDQRSAFRTAAHLGKAADEPFSATGAGQGTAGAAQPCESVVESTAANQTESPVAAPAIDGGSRADDSVEAPPEYMHVNLLTFTLVGMFSGRPDPDLDISASDGPAPARSESSGMRRPMTRALGLEVFRSFSQPWDDRDLVFLINPASASKGRHRRRGAGEKRRALLEETGCSCHW